MNNNELIKQKLWSKWTKESEEFYKKNEVTKSQTEKTVFLKVG